jgi:hypothetical protein
MTSHRVHQQPVAAITERKSLQSQWPLRATLDAEEHLSATLTNQFQYPEPLAKLPR